ncbi:hypothetical protein CH063_07857, partial [Colletotrichum higginsianum]
TYNFPEVARSPGSQTTQPKTTGSAVRRRLKQARHCIVIMARRHSMTHRTCFMSRMVVHLR